MKRAEDQRVHTREWLEGRLELLRRYCLPSMAAQSTTNFTWLLFCDQSTEDWALAALHELAQDCPALRVVTVGADPGRGLGAAVRSQLRPDTEVLITTRMDSDDAIARTYLEAVQSYAEAFHRSGLPALALNFPRGYRLDVTSGTAYHAYMYSNPFQSLFERPGRASVFTVMATAHQMLADHCPAHQDESMGAWLQVIHGGNVSNAVIRTDRELLDISELEPFGDLTTSLLHQDQVTAPP